MPNLKGELTWANLISIGRVALLIICLQIFAQKPLLLSFIILVIILLDALDGYVARRSSKKSKYGGFMDIFCDRAVEIIILFTYAYWDLIPYIIPILFLLRGFATDFLRILNEMYKDEHFKEPLSMGRADNRPMRAISGLSKILAFTTILIHQETGLIFMIIALFINLYRGLPVIFSQRSKALIKKLL